MRTTHMAKSKDFFIATQLSSLIKSHPTSASEKRGLEGNVSLVTEEVYHDPALFAAQECVSANKNGKTFSKKAAGDSKTP